ncbi:MAG: UDP-N-acetylglucosamine 2-epimerase [Bacteroidota bacterium]
MITTIAIFTTTRAEFGLFRPLLQAIDKSDAFEYKLFAGGTHLKKEHGETIHEIEDAGFKIAGVFDYLGNGDRASKLTEYTGRATQQLSKLFHEFDFDFVCVLGDRYELLSVLQAAIIFRKPIIHIHGGEETHGAIDEQIRHMITKAAHVHFASCEEYYQNIRKMGEPDWRIFNTGALAVDNIKQLKPLNKNELYHGLGLDTDKKTALMTYHPVTLETKISSEQQIMNLIHAFDGFDLQVLITSPNMDTENNDLRKAISKHIDNKKFFFTESLGAYKYLSMLHYVDFVIGNSSSGILEVPYYKIPTINIGARQDGRIKHQSILDTTYDTSAIQHAIRTSLDPSFRDELQAMEYKFGEGSVAEKMVISLSSIINRDDLMIKKLDFPC